MLLGTEIGAALTALEPYDIDVIGLNCATGPAEMNEAVRYLSLNSTKQVSVLPNAGLPQNEGGHAVYKLTPQELADYHKQFCAPTNPNILADCAGGFGARVGAIHVNGIDEALAVQPTLRAIRLLMRIQALKRPTNP